MDEYSDEYWDAENAYYSEKELEEIREAYYKKRLIESLIGPVVSCIFHILLIILLAILITDKYKEPVAEIEVVMEQLEEIEIEEPPPVEEPEPQEIEETDTTNPVLTTVAVENAETEDQAIEDTSDDAPSTDDNMAEEAVSDVVVSPSAFASPSVFGGRSASGRAASVSKFGGNKVGQDKLLKALWWLAKVQNPDGSWGENSQQAMTGLALLTFLAHGETQTSRHFGMNVKKAISWLVNDPMKGSHGRGYAHAIKVYALCEAYAMTGVSIIEGAMNKGIRIIIDGQQEGGCYNYSYSKNQERQDLSMAGWNFQAMKAAYGAGCEEKGLNEAIYKAIAWLKKMGGEGAFPYSSKNNQPSGRPGGGKHTMRAVGVLCLQLFGEGKCKEIKDDLETISKVDYKSLNWEKPPHESLYGWYYATQAMFQAGGAKYWKPWNRKFQKELTDNQNKEGYWVYPGKMHGPAPNSLTGKIYATTLCGLMLTVYYRYLPTTKGGLGDMKKADKKAEDIPMVEEGLDLVE